MPDTLTPIRERIQRGYKGDGEANWPAQCFADAEDLLVHIDTLTAAVRALPEYVPDLSGEDAEDEQAIHDVIEKFRAAVLAILREPHE